MHLINTILIVTKFVLGYQFEKIKGNSVPILKWQEYTFIDTIDIKANLYQEESTECK